MGRQKVGKYPLILPTRSGYQFARKLEKRLQYKEKRKDIDFWVPSTIRCFSDSEVLADIHRHIRGEDIYIVADCYSQATTIPFEESDRDPRDKCIRDCKTHTNLEGLIIERKERRVTETTEAQLSVAENFSEAIHVAKAVKNACTEGRVTLVLPSLPYARQDRRTGRQGLSLKHMADSIHGAGIQNVLTMDAHQKATEGFFDASIKFDNLKAGKTNVGYLQRRPEEYVLGDIVLIAPDPSAYENVLNYAKQLGTLATFVYKHRDPQTGLTEMIKLRDLDVVRDRHTMVIDDMISTGGTSVGTAEIIMNAGARAVDLIGSHGIFAPPAINYLDKAYADGIIRRVLITDSVTHKQEILERPWLETVSVISYFAKAITNLNQNRSISGLLSEFGNHK